jgi:hypothetical protein
LEEFDLCNGESSRRIFGKLVEYVVEHKSDLFLSVTVFGTGVALVERLFISNLVPGVWYQVNGQKLILIVSISYFLSFNLSELLVNTLFTFHDVVPLFGHYHLMVALDKHTSWHAKTLLSTISCLSLLCGLQFLIGLRQLDLGRIGILLSLSLWSLYLLALILLFTALLFFTGLISLL